MDKRARVGMRFVVVACALCFADSEAATYQNCWLLNTSDAVVDFSEPSNWKYDDASQTVLTAFPIPSSFLRLYGASKTFYLGKDVSVDNMAFNSINNGVVVVFDLNNEANGGTENRTLSSRFGASGAATLRQSSGGIVRVVSGTLNISTAQNGAFQLDGANCSLQAVGPTAHIVGPVSAGHATSGTRLEVLDGATYEGVLNIGRVNNASFNTLVRAANGGKITLAGALFYNSPNPGSTWSNQVMLAENGGVIDFKNMQFNMQKSNQGAFLCMSNKLWLANDGVLTNFPGGANSTFWRGGRNILAATNSVVHIRESFSTDATYPACSNRVDFIGSTVHSYGFRAAENSAAWGNSVTVAGGTKMTLTADLVFGSGHHNAFVIDGEGTDLHSVRQASGACRNMSGGGRENLIVVSGGAAVTNFYGLSISGTSNVVRVCGANTRLAGEGTFSLSDAATALDNTLEVLDGATFGYERWRVASSGGWGAHLVVSNATALAGGEFWVPHTLASSNNTVRLAGATPLVRATNGHLVFMSNTAVTFDLPATGYGCVPLVTTKANDAKVQFRAGTSIQIAGLRNFLKAKSGVQTVVLAESEHDEVTVDAVTLAAANAELAADGAANGYKAELFLSADGATKMATGSKRYLVLQAKSSSGLMILLR